MKYKGFKEYEISEKLFNECAISIFSDKKLENPSLKFYKEILILNNIYSIKNNDTVNSQLYLI